MYLGNGAIEIILLLLLFIYHFLGSEVYCRDTLTISGGSSKKYCGSTTPAPFKSSLNVVYLTMRIKWASSNSRFDVSFSTFHGKSYCLSVNGERGGGRQKGSIVLFWDMRSGRYKLFNIIDQTIPLKMSRQKVSPMPFYTLQIAAAAIGHFAHFKFLLLDDLHTKLRNTNGREHISID